METFDVLKATIRKRGLRLTPQREKILQIFYELPDGEHLSAEELQNLLEKENSDISLATSYRTLKMFASIGILRELDFAEDHKHYELAGDPDEAPHHHIICMDCGTTEEFESEEIFKLAQEIARKKGIEIVDVQLKLFAVCKPEGSKACHQEPAPLG